MSEAQRSEASASTAGLGVWRVVPGSGYNSRPFWTLRRRNPAWMGGQEPLMYDRKPDERRFYLESKAIETAAALNAPNAKSQATDAALSRRVPSHDGLCVKT